MLDGFVRQYISAVRSPDLPIVHDLRTVYGKGIGSHIAEEKHLFEKSKTVVPHLLPLAAKKIAARPNAIVATDGVLLVRQFMNWMGMEPNAKEYYIFQPLTKEGVNKGTIIVYGHTENGKLERLFRKDISCARFTENDETTCLKNLWDLGTFKRSVPPGIRSENYWKVPTNLDCRLADLDFKERCLEKLEDEEQITPQERVELFFLRKIVEKSREQVSK